MLKAEEQMELMILKKHGQSIRGLSRSTGRSRNTVRRYLRGGEDAVRRKPAPKRAEKLDPFKAYIIERMKAAAPDRIPAAVLFREIIRYYCIVWNAKRAVALQPKFLSCIYLKCNPISVFSATALPRPAAGAI